METSKVAPVAETPISTTVEPESPVWIPSDPVDRELGDCTFLFDTSFCLLLSASEFMKGCLASSFGGPIFYAIALYYAEKTTLKYA